LKIELLTIFPEMFESFLNTSILGRAQAAGYIDVHATDIRPFSASKHKNTDDYPFGGGAGMLMTPQPIADAMKAVTQPPFSGKRIYMSPRGKQLTQALLQYLSNLGACYATLEVRVSNLRAQNLYKALGFVSVGKRKRYYEDNGEDAFLMVCERLPEAEADFTEEPHPASGKADAP